MPPLGGIFNWVKYGRTSINLILDSTGGRMGRITSFIKQVIVFLLVTSLLIRPSFASVGGWTLGGGVAQGASVVYNGTKQIIIDGKEYIKKGTAVITPTATGVAKVLARGVAGVALSVAVEQLLGSVDWVLDPANNQITYTPKNELLCTADGKNCPSSAFIWASAGQYFSTAQNACANELKLFKEAFTYMSKSTVRTQIIDQRSAKCHIDKAYDDGTPVGTNTYAINNVVNPNYLEESEPKSIPLTTVAQKVISNAQGVDAAAQVATTTAAADIVAEAEKDNVKARPIAQQLEASSSTKPADEAAAAESNTATGTQTQNPTKPDATDLKLEFPAFCGWAPIVCEAAQKVISFPITLTDWYETSKSKAQDWATSISEAWTKVKEEYNEKPKENTDTELDIPDPTPPDINTDISFGGSCPATRSVPVSFAGISTEIEFSFQWFCEIASIAKPVIISISAFAAALIVAGVRTEDD